MRNISTFLCLFYVYNLNLAYQRRALDNLFIQGTNSKRDSSFQRHSKQNPLLSPCLKKVLEEK